MRLVESLCLLLCDIWHFWNLTRLYDKDEHKHFIYLFSLNLPLWFEIAASDILISVTTVWL